tara:strand:+ start:1279 stop:3255 length:1977 start_codon:yes stop_codon:yes gene_type:complete
MEMSSPLIQLALLESLKTDKFNDEIDLFLPFIAVTLSSLGELEFTPSMLQKELEKLFGFKPPISAIKVFITRAKKRKLVVRENNAFIPNTIKINEWKNGYEDKKDEAITSLEIIRKDFADFALAKFNKNLSPNDCDTLIIDFIEKNISSVTESRVYEKNELNEDIKNTNHVTASFISHIYKNKNASLDHFARFVKGMLLANYLCFADKISTKKDYKSITVYIDTPIIIGLLGFNGKQEQQTQEEFISLLKTMSIDIRVFDKTINEIEGLLYAWHNNLKHNNYERFNTKTLETLRQMGCDAARLDTEIKLLSSTIKNLGFTIENGYKIIKQYQCDENALEEAISHNFKKGKNLKHDTVSISRIHNMRKGGLIKNLNQSFSLFVTSNTGLVSVANDFFTGEISKNCIPLVVSEQWMTTMFWLKKPDLFGDLPMEQIVSSAYGLLYKDDGFWTTFIKKLKDLEERGVITEDDLTQVRWDSDLLGMVHDISVDVGDNFSDENVFDIVQSIKNKHVAEKDKEIEEIKEVNYKEVAALKNESNSEISGLRETIRKQNERIEKVKLRDHKISKIISILSATLLALVFVVGVFWTAFVNFPPEIIPNKMAEMYKNYWLTGYAAGITILISFLGSFWGLNIFSIFKWVKNKVFDKIFTRLQEEHLEQ